MIRECDDCGLVQTLPSDLAFDEEAQCARCSHILARRRRYGTSLSLLCSGLSTSLLFIALGSTVMSLHAAGRLSSATLFTGPEMLMRRGCWQLAALVVTTVVLMPVTKLAILLVTALAAGASRSHKVVRWMFGFLDRITPWVMIEVFLAGAAVAYSRIVAMAQVELGPALLCAAGVAAGIAAADAALDRDAVWNRLWPGRRELSRPIIESSKLIACGACALVLAAQPEERCPRCHHRLRRRKRNGVSRTWACVVAAALLYVPANIVPVMTVSRFGRGGARTILGGVVELANNHLWPLAIIVFLASVAVPVLKLAVLVVVLVMTQKRSSAGLETRLRMYRFVRAIGRWSMVDVFMLTLLVGLVRMGFIAKVLPEDGALAFAAVVVLTMIATESMDTRLMWDAAVAGHADAMVPALRNEERG